jgi:glycerol dehydrogenase-like iron-containing ADH family enzyme
MKVEVSSIIKCVFLSQIGKVFMFKPNENDWQRKTLGKMYEFSDLPVSMKAGERAIFYSTNYGVKLTEEEYQSVLNSDKDSDDKMSKYHSTTLSNVIKIGFELAILEEKNG